MLSRKVFFLIVAWCTCAGAGLWSMLNYELTPAKTDTARTKWPSSSSLALDPVHPTLVLFLHPKCPCSRATLYELSVLVSDCQSGLAVQILLVRPTSTLDGWEQTELWRTAKQIPGVVVRTDLDGIEAKNFRATTSGQAFLYGLDGRLLYQGGLTASRGHEGDNAGRAALTSLVTTGQANKSRSAVYGCALLDQPLAQRGSRTQCERP
jgi:hypothetical protein